VVAAHPGIFETAWSRILGFAQEVLRESADMLPSACWTSSCGPRAAGPSAEMTDHDRAFLRPVARRLD
jgi:hypothetical protein